MNPSVGTVARTLSRLRPGQALAQPWGRFAPRFVRSHAGPAAVSDEALARLRRWAVATGRFRGDAIAEAEGGLRGEWKLVGLSHRAVLPPLDAPMPRLWRYEIHYRRWLLGAAHLLAAGTMPADAFERWWREAETATRRRDEPWEPYVLARRAWSELGAAGILGRRDIAASAAAAMRALSRVQEFHLGANHLLAGRASVAAAKLLLAGPSPAAAAALERYRTEVGRQTDRDGLHEERSPGYALLALLDLVCVREAAAAADLDTAWLDDEEQRQRKALSFFIRSDGSVAPFHDSVAFGLDPRMLGLDVAAPGGWVLAESGFCGWNGLVDGSLLSLVADFGEPRPRHQPAHQHAAPFAFDLWWDGPWITSLGISSYDAGERRLLERGIRGHAALQVGDGEPAEIWSSFRMGRGYRIRGREAETSPARLRITAAHDGWGGASHERTIECDASSRRITIEDRVRSAGGRPLTARFPLAPGVQAECSAEGFVLRRGKRSVVVRAEPPNCSREPIEVALRFGVRESSEAIVIRSASDHVRLTMRIETTG